MFYPACISPMFGEDCTSRCYCKQGTCNNVDGVCQTPGCISGYEGASCDTRKLTNVLHFIIR